MNIDTDVAHLWPLLQGSTSPLCSAIKHWLYRISPTSLYFSLYNGVTFPLPPSWVNTYISAQAESHSGRIKGLDDKGGHEGRWICNRFIAVVKIPKVTKESALTYAIKTAKKEKRFLVRNNAPRRESGGRVSYPPDRDKSVSCFTT